MESALVMLSDEEFNSRYLDPNDRNPVVKLAANILHELEVHLNRGSEEYKRWGITSNPDNHDLYVTSSFYLKAEDRLFIKCDPFCGLYNEGIVSHQIKVIKIRIAEIKLALTVTGLDKAVKFVPNVIRCASGGIQKNMYYDEVNSPYKYFSSMSIELRFTVNLNSLDPLRYGYFKVLGFPLMREDFLRYMDYVIN